MASRWQVSQAEAESPKGSQTIQLEDIPVQSLTQEARVPLKPGLSRLPF